MKADLVLVLSIADNILTEKITSAGLKPFVYLKGRIEEIDFAVRQRIIGLVTSNAYSILSQDIEQLPSLRFIGRLGSGMEIIDVSCAHEKGIECWSSPEGNANAVAEHALGMLIGLQNRMRSSMLELQKGCFLRKENTSRELPGLKVGIVGYGTNGKLFADKLLSLGCHVLAVDIEEKSNIPADNRFQFSLDPSSLTDCDVVSLHIPYNSATHHYVNHAFIHGMPHPFTLINCARGGLVDTDALHEGLVSGQILNAGIDVWEYEPLDLYPAAYKSKIDFILNHPHVIATPHIAGYSFEAFYKMSAVIGDKILAWSERNNLVV